MFFEEWDAFVDLDPLRLKEQNLQLPIFKSDDREDYYRFRSVCQVLDLSLYDPEFVHSESLEHVALAAIATQICLSCSEVTRTELGSSELDITALKNPLLQ